MAASKSEEATAVEAAEFNIRERFFGSGGVPSNRQKRGSTASRKQSLKRSCPDDPVSSDSNTSYRLDEPVILQMSDKGALAQKPITVMTALQMAADRYQDTDAFAVKVNGKWQMTKLRDMYQMVRTAAKGFLRLGLTRCHSVAILGYNAPEWIISFLGAIFAGGVALGIHYNYPVEEVLRLAVKSHCNIFVVDSNDDLAKVLKIRSKLPNLVSIVQYGTEGFQKTEGVHSWAELIELGNQASEERLKESILSQAPNYCCAVAFTPGSTGPSKPVMLSHDNIIWTGRIMGKYQNLSSCGGVHVSFLPLSQPSGIMLDIIIPLIYATTVYFVSRKFIRHKLIDVMREVRPTFVVTPPLAFDRIGARLEVKFDSNAISRRISKMAMNVGWKAYLNAKDGKPRPFGWWWANQLVFKKVRHQLGLDRCIEVLSGKNFLLEKTAEFFIKLGINILNVYGGTEMSGPHAFCLAYRHRLGSCGVEMDGARTKFVPIDKTIYQEMRVKGRHVFMGYLNEEQMTADAFDEEGWYKTRDIGYRDESGFLWIIGTTNALFQLADGRIVAPSPVEQTIKNQLPFINHCIVCGRNRQHTIALLTFESMTDETTDAPLDVLSKRAEMWLRRMNVEVSAISKMVENPPVKLVVAIQTAIDKVNTSVLDFGTAIKKWKFLPRDFSAATGELSCNYRLKRNLVLDLYAKTIADQYDSS